MIPELGQITLLLALAVALILGTLPLVGAARAAIAERLADEARARAAQVRT